jgi:hypothetical protein
MPDAVNTAIQLKPTGFGQATSLPPRVNWNPGGKEWSRPHGSTGTRAARKGDVPTGQLEPKWQGMVTSPRVTEVLS